MTLNTDWLSTVGKNRKKKNTFCPKCQSDDVSWCALNYNYTCNKCGNKSNLGKWKEWSQTILDANGNPIK